MVTAHNLYFLSTVAVFVGGLIAIAGYHYGRRRRSTDAGWDELFKKLTWIDRSGIARVALDMVDESGRPIESEDAANLDASQLWTLIGGLEGLEILEANSEVLIDLACYVQQRYPEALVIAERLRLDARELHWHVGRLKGAARTGNLQVSFPFYAQRAVVAYYLMTRRVLRLYEAANLATLADLQKAL